MKKIFKTIRYSIYLIMLARIVAAVYLHVKDGGEDK